MNLLAQVQELADRQEWDQVTYHLQQLLLANSQTDWHPNDWNQALELAIAVVRSGDFQEAWDVAKLFSKFGQRAIVPLLDLLQDEAAELESRWFAARILGELGDPTAIQGLVEMMQSPEDDLAAIATEALANLGSSAVEALTELLQDETTRLSAVRALAQIRRADTIFPLLTVVEDAQPLVRATAIEALGSFQSAAVVPVLVNALEDPAATVRQVAVAALGVRSADTAHDLEALLVKRLHDSSLEVCQQAALALGRLGHETVVTALTRRLLSEPVPLPLQLDLVRAIAWHGSLAALDALNQALQRWGHAAEAHSLCCEIISHLGRWSEAMAKPQAASILIALLTREPTIALTSDVRSAIALALGQLGDASAIPALINLLADDHPGVRLHAIAALKQVDATLARQYLDQLKIQNNLPASLQRGVTIALQEW
jgi:HEAT repeat protein